MRRLTAGWQRCVQWKDGSALCEKLSGLKELYPIKYAGYAVAQNLQSEPAFKWWVGCVIKKRERIVSLVKKRNARNLKRNEKSDVDLLNNVEEAHHLDENNVNDLWEMLL